jgi:hypothetical protein
METNPQLLQKRLREFLRPRVTAKTLARAIPCDPRTAENMMGGHWPAARHWLGLIRVFGDDVVEAVFRPEDAAERLEREIRALERRKDELLALAAHGPGPAPRREKAVAAHENGSAR